MTPDDLFGMASAAVLPGWVILIFAPRRWAVLNAVPALILPAALSLLYAVLVLRYFAGATGNFSSIDGVRSLFADDWALLAGWVHYLAFDLMIGAYLANRLDRAGIDRVIQAFVLPLVFLFGPLGLIFGLLTDWAKRPLSIAISMTSVERA